MPSLKETNAFIQQACVSGLKVSVKTFIMLQKMSISNTCYFELSIHQRILKKGSKNGAMQFNT